MMKNKLVSLAVLVFLGTTNFAYPQGTAFTYQGKLTEGGNPASGYYDLRFVLYDGSIGGAQQGPTLTNTAASVSVGLFTVVLDFGPGVLTGADRWLEIAARTNGIGGFVTLSPRQALTATPYATTASNLTGVLPASGLAGTYSGAVTLGNSGNSFSGNGANLTSLNAGQLASGTVNDTRLSSNVALRAGGNTFTGNQVLTSGNVGIGTNNPQAKLDVVGNSRAVLVRASAAGDSSFLEFANATGIFRGIIGADGNGFTGTPNQFSIGSWTGHPIKLFTAAAERMTIDAAGRVGIGTSTPAFPLSLADTLGDKISLYGSSGNHYGFGMQGLQMQIHTDTSAADIVFGYGQSTNLTERMRIKGTGNVGIGTPNPSANMLQINTNYHLANGYGLQVNRSDYGANIQINRTNGQGGIGLIVDNSSSGDQSTALLLARNSAASGAKNVLDVRANGDTFMNGSLNLNTGTYPGVTAFIRARAGDSLPLAVQGSNGVNYLLVSTNGDTTLSGGLSAGGTISGNGSGLTGLSASSLGSGTVADARLSSNVALRSGGNTFNGNQTLTNGSLYMDNTQAIWAKNTNGAYEVFLWPRYADNVTYFDYGAAGLSIRNNSGVPAMFIQNDGKVGLGTTFPGANLQAVNSGSGVGVFVGNLNPFGDAAFETAFTAPATHAWFSENGTNVFNVGGGGSGYFAGPVSVGGSLFVGSGSQQINLNHGGYNNYTMTVKQRSGDAVAFAVLDSGGNNFMSLQSSGTKGLYLYGVGSCTDSVFWNIISDERFKQDIRPYEFGLNEVLQLHTVRYRYKEDPKRGLTPEKPHTGVLAQEVRKVFPDAVLEDEDGYLSLQADPIFWASVRAIQELNQKVQERDAKISELEKRMSQLEKAVEAIISAK